MLCIHHPCSVENYKKDSIWRWWKFPSTDFLDSLLLIISLEHFYYSSCVVQNFLENKCFVQVQHGKQFSLSIVNTNITNKTPFTKAACNDSVQIPAYSPFCWILRGPLIARDKAQAKPITTSQKILTKKLEWNNALQYEQIHSLFSKGE